MSHKFEVRGFNLVESVLRHSEEELRRFIRRMKKLRMNTLIAHYDYGWKRFNKAIIEETEKAGVEISLMIFGPRTIFRLVDYKPEWFAKHEDGTLLSHRLECDSKPCVSYPEAIEAYGEGARKLVATLPPNIKRVQLRYADGSRYCQCPNCRNIPEDLQWLPFLKASLKAFAEIRPDIRLEYDAYVKRWDVSQDHSIFDHIDRVMFDTFGRQPNIPVGRPGQSEDRRYLVSKRGCREATLNEYLAERISEWCRIWPGKPYIHENLMVQGQLSINGDHTGVLLDDLRLYRDLGVAGVCYEAYELGYEHFEKTIEVLAGAMWDLDSANEYKPSPLEQEITSGKWDVGWIFCKDPHFPLEKYIKDKVVLDHVRNYRDLLNDGSAYNLKKMAAHVFENRERFDPVWTAFHGCQWCMNEGNADFSNLSEEAADMLDYTKLWDFMEDIDIDKDPRYEAEKLVLQAVEQVK